MLKHPTKHKKVPIKPKRHTSDLKIGTPVATLPGAWRYWVSAGTGRPGVSILWLGEVESWICNFYLSVAARKIDPALRYTCCWDVKQPTNKQSLVIWNWQWLAQATWPERMHVLLCWVQTCTAVLCVMFVQSLWREVVKYPLHSKLKREDCYWFVFVNRLGEKVSLSCATNDRLNSQCSRHLSSTLSEIIPIC